MTKEDKELVLKDLCARLSYGAIINVHDTFTYTVLPHFNIRLNSFVSTLTLEPIFKTKDKLIKKILKEHAEYLEFKPFLRPMSSMTEEEKDEYDNICGFYGIHECEHVIDWLNEHHFDYRGLIPMGLALEASEGMYDIKIMNQKPVPQTLSDYEKIKKILSLGFMNLLDDNRSEHKMCLSNMECEDIDNAFDNQDWSKLLRYFNKYYKN